jgi:hypothetical protein
VCNILRASFRIILYLSRVTPEVRQDGPANTGDYRIVGQESQMYPLFSQKLILARRKRSPSSYAVAEALKYRRGLVDLCDVVLRRVE